MVRGAKIDYVNKNGNTALHLCIDSKLVDAVKFLLFKGANPHIMDLIGEDACDKAKRNGLAVNIPEFNNCNINLKILPLLPDGTHADVGKNMPVFKKQLEMYAEHKDSAYKRSPYYKEPEEKGADVAPR